MLDRVLNHRLKPFEKTIFSEMSRLAQRTGAINLGQGFPDTDGPSEIIEAAVRALREGYNQYPPTRGFPELRRAVAEHQRRFYSIALDPETEVVATTGATEGVSAALLALCEPGDEVVVLEPFYDSYAAVVALAGAALVPVTLRPPGFRPDLRALESAITPRTRLILLNSPHNPTGVVLSRAELEGIAELARDRELLVVTDEVHEHLVYDPGVEHVPISTLPGMRERTVSASSAAKTFSLTGWKVGWVTGPEELVSAVHTAKQYLTFTSGGPFQPAVAAALGLPDAYFERLRAALRRKRDLLAGALKALGLEVFRPAGTYFITTDIEPLGESDGMGFCLSLPRRCGVVAVPNAVFYQDAVKGGGRSLVRFTFCKRDEVLREAIARLQRLPVRS
ncbi:MAG TPA: pyridoxal phosphate-dependent aminotransferase [Actinomycetes bacterium]|nr:pyridoxal phosphate-dependent aminotransferase [Actinomycetes bacterium]